MERASYRNRRVKISADERKRDKAKAERIDRDEQAAIKAQARRVKARRDMLHAVLQELKAERQRQALSLGQLSERTGMDKAALSRLENAANANPKLDTLVRYAQALGVTLRISVEGKAA